MFQKIKYITLDVVSSNIMVIVYTPTKKELIVTFETGNSYLYLDVPAEVFAEFLNTESIGSTFATKIQGHFTFERI